MDSDKTTVERQPATTAPRSTVTFHGTNIEWRREGKTWTLYSGDEVIRGASWEERQLIDACLAATPSQESQAPQPDPEKRLTLVHSLMASKGWMMWYAEAFVDDFVHPSSPSLPLTRDSQDESEGSSS